MLSLFSGLAARARSLVRGVRRTADVDAEMDEEFRYHIELRAADLARSGIPPAEALRRARLEFGSTARYKDDGRESRGLRRFDDLRASWLDFKLGFRMLIKYPGLTLVGGLALAFAIWLGAGAYQLVTQMLRPALPFPDGARIVGIVHWDAAESRVERRATYDLVRWRAELRSLRDLGAFRDVDRNLIVGDGAGDPVRVAEMSASAFRITRVPPLLGRTLVEADEQPGAPPVVVIGHDVWRSRFAGDPAIIGRSVQLGSASSTIVGVMPEGFAFPVNHGFWVPLRIAGGETAARQGPGVSLFGRLASGVSLGEAQLELSASGARAAADFPETHRHLRPRVIPYARSITDPSGEEMVAVMSLNVPVAMLVILVCANVALLLFARAATREGEIIVRTALGASRGRIVMQLFAEALVLGAVAAVVGLSAAGFGLRRLMDAIRPEMSNGQLPFWVEGRLSPETLLYAAGLTVLAAAIAGVLPALKVTRRLSARLRMVGTGGGGLRFGGVWTLVIVSQVALTVAFPAFAFVARGEAAQLRSVEVAFPVHEYLSARLEMDREPRGADTTRAAFAARFRETARELERRLMVDPAVVAVTFADLLPRMDHPEGYIAIDEGGGAPRHPRWPFGYVASRVSVEPDFLEVLGAPILAGRGFRPTDIEPGRHAAIVNEEFVDSVFAGHNPIGRRIRDVDYRDWKAGVEPSEEKSPWYEVVGVVRDPGMSGSDANRPGFYRAVSVGELSPARVAVHVRGDPAAFAPRLREIAAAVDPTLRLYDVQPLERVTDTAVAMIGFWFRLLLVVSAVALTLSLAGIYAVMSFTVARRTREIGIRIALGASPRRVVAAIFRQPLSHVAIGIAAGTTLVAGVLVLADGDAVTARRVAMVAGYAALMLGISLLACVVPTRRALSVEPTEALKSE